VDPASGITLHDFNDLAFHASSVSKSPHAAAAWREFATRRLAFPLAIGAASL